MKIKKCLLSNLLLYNILPKIKEAWKQKYTLKNSLTYAEL